MIFSFSEKQFAKLRNFATRKNTGDNHWIWQYPKYGSKKSWATFHFVRNCDDFDFFNNNKNF